MPSGAPVELESLIVKMLGDSSGYDKMIKDVEKTTQDAIKKMESATTGLEQSFKSTFTAPKQSLEVMGASISSTTAKIETMTGAVRSQAQAWRDLSRQGAEALRNIRAHEQMTAAFAAPLRAVGPGPFGSRGGVGTGPFGFTGAAPFGFHGTSSPSHVYSVGSGPFGYSGALGQHNLLGKFGFTGATVMPKTGAPPAYGGPAWGTSSTTASVAAMTGQSQQVWRGYWQWMIPYTKQMMGDWITNIRSHLNAVGGFWRVFWIGTFLAIPMASALRVNELLHRTMTVVREQFNQVGMKTQANFVGDAKAAGVRQIYEISKAGMSGADELAAAYGNLIRAGWGASSAFNALRITEQLTIATGGDVVGVTKAITGSMQALGLHTGHAARDLQNLSQYTDMLAYAATAANVSVQEMAQGLSGRTAAAIKEARMPLSQAIAMETVLARQGMGAGGIATHMEQMIKIYTRSVTLNQSFWDNLFGKRNSVVDAQGRIRPFIEMLGMLRERFKGFSDLQKSWSLEQLGFNRMFPPHMIEQWMDNIDAVKQFQKGIEDATGTRLRMATSNLDSMTAHLAQLKNAFMELFETQEMKWFIDALKATVELAKRALWELNPKNLLKGPNAYDEEMRAKKQNDLYAGQQFKSYGFDIAKFREIAGENAMPKEAQAEMIEKLTGVHQKYLGMAKQKYGTFDTLGHPDIRKLEEAEMMKVHVSAGGKGFHVQGDVLGMPGSALADLNEAVAKGAREGTKIGAEEGTSAIGDMLNMHPIPGVTFKSINLSRFGLEGPGGLSRLEQVPKMQQVQDKAANAKLQEMIYHQKQFTLTGP